MLDPEIIPASRRRIGAFAIDFGLIALLTALVGRSQLQRFEILERTPGSNEPIWSAAQFEDLARLSQGFTRKFEQGDTLFVIDGMGVLVTLLAGMALTAIMFVAIPAKRGWSPGKKVFSLRVIDRDGAQPSPLDLVVRTVVGLIDLIPFVIPGLLGFVLASKDAAGRRLGDRVAGTTVVDARKPVRYVDPAVLERRALLEPDDDGPIADVDDSMVDLDARLSATGGRQVPRSAPTENDGADDVWAELDQERPHDQQLEAEIPTGAESRTQIQPQPRPEPEAGSPERVGGSYPRPSHRESDADPPFSGTWDRPIAEPAPVWYPTELQPAGAAAASSEHAAASSEHAAASSEHAAASSESAAVATTAVRTTPIGASDSLETATIETATLETATLETDAATPIWNEQWQAWLYWDSSTQQWLRHDEAHGVWVAIS